MFARKLLHPFWTSTLTALLVPLTAVTSARGGDPVYTFSHLAGSTGGSGGVDGIGSAAKFQGPLGVAVDAAGTAYIADTYNHVIRKITAAGAVTLLAGKFGQEGFADGASNAARFSFPYSIAVDASGVVYVGESHGIRKITADGTVSTVVGTDAGLNGPSGLVTDGAGGVYVSDTYNHIIRKVTSAGVVSTVAGTSRVPGSANGAGAAASFNLPHGIAIDAVGNLYVADAGTHIVRKITPTGDVTTLAGSAGTSGSADGTGSAAQFSQPFGVAVDPAGVVYVADWAYGTVRKITATGVVTTLTSERLTHPAGLARDAAGNLLVAEYGVSLIRKVSSAGSMSILAGSSPTIGSADGAGATASFWLLGGLALGSSGDLVVTDHNNHTVRRVTGSGVVTTVAGRAGDAGGMDGQGTAATFSNPAGIATDAGNNIYVADKGNHIIRKISPQGVVTTIAGTMLASGSIDGVGAAARFYGPNGIAADAQGNVYVSEVFNHTIRKITPGGLVSTLAGSAGESGSADGAGAAARFRMPGGLVVDPASGDLFVADTGNQTIRRVTPAGVVTTFAGAAGRSGLADGIGGAAEFYGPNAVAIDTAGNLYVAEDARVRKITPAGVVTSLGGVSAYYGNVDGVGSEARFNWIRGIAVDAAGALFLADARNNAIRKGVPSLSLPPTIESQPKSFGPPIGAPASFSVVVTSSQTVTYQWQSRFGAELWKDLPEVAPYSGTKSATLTISPVGLEHADLQVRCIATGNGSVTSDSATVSIVKLPPGVFFSSLSQTYTGESRPVGVSTLPVGLPYTVTYNGKADVPRNAGSYEVVLTIDSENYMAKASTTLVVAKAPLTITAADRSKVQGEENPALTYTFSGFVNGETPAVLDVLPVISTTAETKSPVGSYPISLTGGSDDNYTLILRSATLSVSAVKIAPAITSAGNASFITGYAADFTFTATGSPSPTFTATGLPAWAKLDVGTGKLTGTPTTAAGSPYNVTLTASNGVSPAANQTFVLTVEQSAAPVFTVQPVSTTVNVSRAAVFSVSAKAIPEAAFQWQITYGDGTSRDVEDSATFSGATTSTLTIAKVSLLVDGGKYRCVATNALGSTASDSAKLTVVGALFPTFTTQPKWTAAVIGAPASFTAIAVSDPVASLQWEMSADGGASWIRLSNDTTHIGVTSNTLSIAATTNAMNGRCYRCIASVGNISIYSATATLNVSAAIGNVGTYFGGIAGGGSWALRVNPDGSGTFIASITYRGTAISTRLSVAPDGGFISLGSELTAQGSNSGILPSLVTSGKTGRPRAAVGSFVLNGKISGSSVTGVLEGIGASFSGEADKGAAASEGGYYVANAQSGSATTYAIVAPSGQAFVVAVTPTGVESVEGKVGETGRLAAVTTSGGAIAVTVAPGVDVMEASLTQAGSTTPIQFLTVQPAGSRLANLSVRSRAGKDEKTLIMGFVVAGSGSNQILVRGLGPRLSDFGVSDALTDPKIRLFAPAGEIDSNDNWGGGSTLSDTFVVIGATPLTPSSRDAALLRSVTGDVYSAHVTTSDNGSGIALAEIYDVNKVGARLINVSARCEVQGGDDLLVAGFVLEGSGAKTLLIRGLGPTLESFGVTGALVNPQLKVLNSAGVQIESNDDWAGSDALKNASVKVGAVPLSSDASKDSGLLVNLPPGVYSVQLSGVNNASGVALVEIYEVP